MNRRREDDWILSRAQVAGIAGMVLALLQSGAALADLPDSVHTVIEAIATGVLFVGGAMLAMVRDPRCFPKMDRLNRILMRALARRLHVPDDPDPPTQANRWADEFGDYGGAPTRSEPHGH
jgi:hypothetical protein